MYSNIRCDIVKSFSWEQNMALVIKRGNQSCRKISGDKVRETGFLVLLDFIPENPWNSRHFQGPKPANPRHRRIFYATRRIAHLSCPPAPPPFVPHAYPLYSVLPRPPPVRHRTQPSLHTARAPQLSLSQWRRPPQPWRRRPPRRPPSSSPQPPPPPPPDASGRCPAARASGPRATSPSPPRLVRGGRGRGGGRRRAQDREARASHGARARVPRHEGARPGHQGNGGRRQAVRGRLEGEAHHGQFPLQGGVPSQRGGPGQAGQVLRPPPRGRVRVHRRMRSISNRDQVSLAPFVIQ